MLLANASIGRIGTRIGERHEDVVIRHVANRQEQAAGTGRGIPGNDTPNPATGPDGGLASLTPNQYGIGGAEPQFHRFAGPGVSRYAPLDKPRGALSGRRR